MGRSLRIAALAIGFLMLAAPALAEVEENHHFSSLAGLVAGADVTFLGTVQRVGPRDFGGGDSCRYVDVHVRVESVLAHRRGPLPGSHALFVDWECGPAVHKLVAEYAGTRAIFFGDASRFQVPGGAPWHWIPTILAGHVHERSGTAHVPETLNAPFLTRLEGTSFRGLVERIRALASDLPATDAGPTTLAGATSVPPVTAAGLLGGLAVSVLLIRRRRLFAAGLAHAG